jgi:hypothetical protein
MATTARSARENIVFVLASSLRAKRVRGRVCLFAWVRLLLLRFRALE